MRNSILDQNFQDRVPSLFQLHKKIL